MPRFYFNLYDGVVLPDKDGTELPDWQHARAEVLQFAGELLKDKAIHDRLADGWHIEVTDEQGLILFRLDFTIVNAPAVAPLRPDE